MNFIETLVNNANSHAYMAKLEKDVFDADVRCQLMIEALDASQRDLRGKTILQHGRTYDGGMMFVFTDNTYIKLIDGKETESYGVDTVFPSTDDAARFGVLSGEMIADYEKAKLQLEKAQSAYKTLVDANTALRNVVAQLGKDAVKKLIETL